MAKSKPMPRIYLCATEWIGLLMGEKGAPEVRALIDRANVGAFDIVGSELLRIEVLQPGGADLLDASVRTWAAMDRRIANRTRELRQLARDAGRPTSRNTPDFIHIATAQVGGVDAFITTDLACRNIAEFCDLPVYGRAEYPPGEIPGMP